MNGFDTDGGGLDGARFGMALLELEAGMLEPLRREELMAQIARSPAAQRAYLEYFESSAMLAAEASTHAEQRGLPQVIDSGSPARLFRRSLLAAAALVLLGAFVATLIKVARPSVPELALAAVADSRWSVLGEVRHAAEDKATVREGATLRVESGTLELRLESGAMMVVQGPAVVSFAKLREPRVRGGWLWIDSGKERESFEVHTPELRIRNLGTRFGVRVPREGPAEVHLVEGELVVTSERMPGESLRLATGGQAMAIPRLDEPTSLDPARDPFPEIAELLAAPSNYPTTVRGQNPAGYWRLDDAPNGRLRNEVEGGTPGGVAPGSDLAADGPGPADRLPGFVAGNRAWRTSRSPEAKPLSLGATHGHDGLLFSDTFSRDGPLDGIKPDVSVTDAQWVSAPSFHADGRITGGPASATLDFHPIDGMRYTLEAELRGITTIDGSENWVALGFASGQSATASDHNRFIEREVVGRAWMLCRGTGGTHDHHTHLSGTFGGRPWQNWTTGLGGDIDLRIVLDTTEGMGRWSATWFARRPGEESFTRVRERTQLPNEAIDSAGIAVTGDDIRARIANISLGSESVLVDASAPWRAAGPSPLTRRSGAVSCWLRRDPGVGRAEILWSAGENPNEDGIHAWLEVDGRVGFFMENGRYDVLLASEETIAAGRWHHFAASWSPYTVALYLDGRRVAGEREFRGLQQGTLPELRAGGGPQTDGAAHFTGRIDEIAVWDRMLTSIEIEQQYRSARGTSSLEAANADR